ncbi:iron-containing alcohol dehydrogenase [Pokkaliibacter sp. CJK22405]|uniref:iron-containing alcohol dehydrogenase n=1 Tax=Pokkaliibacter sp. CJK22405 TaxID=3384615 RepID=UPI0039847461
MTQTAFSFLSAGEIRFGRGVSAAVAEELAARYQRILLVRGANPARSAHFCDVFRDKGASVTPISILREPALEDIEAALITARDANIQAVISLGGGAVIDAGKAIAALVSSTGPVQDYLEVVGTSRRLEHDPLPFIAIPTTFGTGAEVTKNAVIDVPEHQRKVSLRDNRMLPTLAVIDPALNDHCPRSVTLASGLDAITQVIEPYLCSRANPMTDALCRDAIPRGLNALASLMQEESTEARDEMAWTSLCGGLALANAGLGVIHGLAGPLGGVSSAPHGAICGALLPYGLALNLSQLPEDALVRKRFQEVAVWISQSLGGSPDMAFETLRQWSRDAGLNTLKELGIGDELLKGVAEAAGASSSMKANPVSLSAEDLLQMLTLAHQGKALSLQDTTTL